MAEHTHRHPQESVRERFHHVAVKTSNVVGAPWTFVIAIVAVVAWAVTGPLFGFSNTWQLVINTATTIITFLMVFLIQNTQNRDNRALQLKLDEVIRALHGARNSLVDLEESSEEELERIANEFRALKNQPERTPRRPRRGNRAGRRGRRAGRS